MNGYCPATGKVRFTSQHKAAHQLRKFGNGGEIYRCTQCHDWHVAHSAAKAPNTNARRARALALQRSKERKRKTPKVHPRTDATSHADPE